MDKNCTEAAKNVHLTVTNYTHVTHCTIWQHRQICYWADNTDIVQEG